MFSTNKTSAATTKSASEIKATLTPRVIHFIWAGGEKPFPNQEIIRAWQAKNPGFQMVLWIDKDTTPPSVFKGYEKEGYVPASDISQIGSTQASAPLLMADISLLGPLDPRIRYELNRKNSNYGLSSDLLRYDILYKIGGAYFDSDILPGEKSLLESGFDFNSKESQLRGSLFTQGEQAVGNDAFICSPRNPDMLGLYEFCLARSKCNMKGRMDQAYETTMSINGETGNISWTVRTSGPGAVSDYLEEKLHKSPFEDNSEGKAVYSTAGKAYALNSATYEAKSRNDRNWINSRVKSSASLNEAMKCTLEEIEYETKNMGFVRIAEQVREMGESLLRPFMKTLVKITSDVKEEASDLIITVTSGKDKIKFKCTEASIRELQNLCKELVTSGLILEEQINPAYTQLLKGSIDQEMLDRLISYVTPGQDYLGAEKVYRKKQSVQEYRDTTADLQSGKLSRADFLKSALQEAKYETPKELEIALAKHLLDALPTKTLIHPSVKEQEKNYKFMPYIDAAVALKVATPNESFVTESNINATSLNSNNVEISHKVHIQDVTDVKFDGEFNPRRNEWMDYALRMKNLKPENQN